MIFLRKSLAICISLRGSPKTYSWITIRYFSTISEEDYYSHPHVFLIFLFFYYFTSSSNLYADELTHFVTGLCSAKPIYFFLNKFMSLGTIYRSIIKDEILWSTKYRCYCYRNKLSGLETPSVQNHMFHVLICIHIKCRKLSKFAM